MKISNKKSCYKHKLIICIYQNILFTNIISQKLRIVAETIVPGA